MCKRGCRCQRGQIAPEQGVAGAKRCKTFVLRFQGQRHQELRSVHNCPCGAVAVNCKRRVYSSVVEQSPAVENMLRAIGPALGVGEDEGAGALLVVWRMCGSLSHIGFHITHTPAPPQLTT
jgi:hypothetical protein